MSNAPTEAASPASLPIQRTELWIPAGGARCAAWFYAPEGITDPPLVVMAHGLGGTRHMRLDAYARTFAAAGIAALVFDYRGFGDSEGSPRQIVAVKEQLADWRSALAFARAELPVDRSRIALWGTSFGGGHVLSIAAEDHGLAGVVAQCPFVDGPSSVWRRFLASPISAAILMVLAVIDGALGLLRRPPLLVPMAGTWWMPAFLAARDSLPGAATQLDAGSRVVGRSARWLERLPSVRRQLGDGLVLDRTAPAPAGDSIWGVIQTPDGGSMINAIAARLVLTLGLYRPVRRLGATGTTPILVCACDHDTAAPPAPIIRAGERHANVDVRRYPYGHFDIYVGDGFAQAAPDQLAFLKRVLQVEVSSHHAASGG